LRSELRRGMGKMELSQEFIEKLSEIFFKDEIDNDFIDLRRFDKY